MLRSHFGLIFALDTAQSSSVYMKINRVFAVLLNAQIQAASHYCMYNFRPNDSPHKTQHRARVLLH